MFAAVSEPVILVGPWLEPAPTIDGGSVLACVDSSPASERVVAPAAAWQSSSVGTGYEKAR